jgi:hypothetical protein
MCLIQPQKVPEELNDWSIYFWLQANEYLMNIQFQLMKFSKNQKKKKI